MRAVTVLIITLTTASILQLLAQVRALGFYREIGEPCVQKSYWESTRKGTCDEQKGYSCQNYPEYGGWVCACSVPYGYDPQSNECRRKLGSHCQHMNLSRTKEVNWYDKCQENAECALGTSVSGRPAGVCKCKAGYDPSYGGDFCERFY